MAAMMMTTAMAIPCVLVIAFFDKNVFS